MSNEMLKQVDLSSIDVEEGFNVRNIGEAARERLLDLGQNIATQGLRNPLVVFINEQGRFTLVAGHRRLAAITLYNESVSEPAKVVKVIAVVHKKMSMEERLNTMGADVYSEPLSPLEFSLYVEKLMAETHLSKADVARKFSLSPAYVGDLTLLAAAPAEVKDAVRAEEISSTLATELLKSDGAEETVKLIEAAREVVKQEEQAETVEAPEEAFTYGHDGKPRPVKSRAKATPKSKPKTKARNTKKAITKRTIDKVKGKEVPATSATRASLHDQYLDAADILVARFRKGEDIKDQVGDLSWLIRESAMAGIRPAKGLSGITAETPDTALNG